MSEHKKSIWPSGDCRPVLATRRKPSDLANIFNVTVFRDRDDLDWFDAALVHVEKIGSVLIQKHENMPDRSTVFYVDSRVKVRECQLALIAVFKLDLSDISWRPSSGADDSLIR